MRERERERERQRERNPMGKGARESVTLLTYKIFTRVFVSLSPEGRR